jgi:hypothetical protein
MRGREPGPRAEALNYFLPCKNPPCTVCKKGIFRIEQAALFWRASLPRRTPEIRFLRKPE